MDRRPRSAAARRFLQLLQNLQPRRSGAAGLRQGPEQSRHRATTFLISLPGLRTQTPKLDLHPRRILLGNMLVGESKTVPLTITNQGQGVLQGTVSISAGQDWLSLSDGKAVHEADITTMREQVVKVTINAKGVAGGQTYGGKLTVVTNGGVVEVPLRKDLVAQPFGKPPFQGVRCAGDWRRRCGSTRRLRGRSWKAERYSAGSP